MNKKIRVSSLSRLFGIEQESWDDYPYPNDGYFDAQLNYHFGDEYFPSILFPACQAARRRSPDGSAAGFQQDILICTQTRIICRLCTAETRHTEPV